MCLQPAASVALNPLKLEQYIHSTIIDCTQKCEIYSEENYIGQIKKKRLRNKYKQQHL